MLRVTWLGWSQEPPAPPQTHTFLTTRHVTECLERYMGSISQGEGRGRKNRVWSSLEFGPGRVVPRLFKSCEWGFSTSDLTSMFLKTDRGARSLDNVMKEETAK